MLTSLHHSTSTASTSRWIQAVNKRPEDRSPADVSLISTRLRTFPAFSQLHPKILFDFSRHLFVDTLEVKLTLFREGEERLNYFYVLSGSLDASITGTSCSPQDTISLCSLGVGCSFGFSNTSTNTHSMTVTSKEPCTLLRVRRDTFQQIWSSSDNLKTTSSSHDRCPSPNKRKSLPALPTEKSYISRHQKQQQHHQYNEHQRASSPFHQTSSDQLVNNTYTNVDQTSSTNINFNPPSYDISGGQHQQSSFPVDSSAIFHQHQQATSAFSMSPQHQFQLPPTLHHQQQALQPQLQGRNSLPLPSLSASSPGQGLSSSSISTCRCTCSSSPSSLQVIKDLKEPSTQLLRIGWVLRTCLLIDAPHLVKNRRMSRGDSLSSTPSASYSPNPSFHGSAVNATSSPSHSPPIFASNAKRSPSIVGSDLVDWLLLSSAQTPVRIHSRSQATSMWQVLFEDRVLVKAEEVEDDHRRVSTTSCCHSQYSSSGGLDEGLMSRTSTTSCLGCSCQSCRPRVFEDKYTMYTFWFDCEGREAHYPVTGHDRRVAEREFAHSLAVLCQMAPDAHLRTILRKPPHERMEDDISLIFDELIQIPALSELTASVKQELAHVISYEFHPKKGTVVFNQGDVGSWWYVIFRGSVLVNIAGKGTVCTLKEGEEFGKLALVNNAPRAATIITAEENTQFFKVPKEDFHRILVDVEANTIRLKEHGQDALILLRLAVKGTTPPNSDSGYTSSSTSSSFNSTGGEQRGSGIPSNPSASSKLVVIAGTPAKMIEYCLESKFDNSWSPAEYQFSNYYFYHSNNNNHVNGHQGPPASGTTSLYSAHLDLLAKDTFFEDFVLTFLIFMTSSSLCHYLHRYYRIEEYDTSSITDDEFVIRSKKRVVRLLYSWKAISGDHFLSDAAVISFVKTIESSMKEEHLDSSSPYFHKLTTEYEMIKMMSRDIDNFEKEYATRGIKKWKSDLPGVLQIMTINGTSSGSTGLVGSFRDMTSSSSSSSGQSSGQTSRSASGFASTMITAAAIPGVCPPSDSSQMYSTAPGSLPLSSGGGYQTRNYSSSGVQTLSSSSLVNMQEGGVTTTAAGATTTNPPSALLSSAYTSTNLGSAFVSGTSNGMGGISSPVGPNLPSLPIVPAGVAEYMNDPYYQDPIRPKDEIITRIYYADHTYTTLKYSMATSALKIKEVAAEKLSIREPLERLLLVEVKSNGERVIFSDKEISIGTGLSVNGRIFVSLKDHLDALTTLPEQEGPRTTTFNTIDEFSALDLAYHLTHYAWVLFNNVHERELIFQVFGREKFNRITSNLDLFLRHFEEVQYWVTTEIVLCSSLSKRVQLLRKLIKTAQVCKEFQNLHTFFAIVFGLSNIAVSRLTQTWERLPSKVKRVYTQFETLIDPSRNQRLYRLYLSTLEPPVIPFTPLLLKDMTFAHEGNKTWIDRESQLVNFEKMQMLAQAMRTFRYCKSKPLSSIESSVISSNASSSMPLNRKINRKIEFYIKNLHVIDSQKILTHLSHTIEPNNKK